MYKRIYRGEQKDDIALALIAYKRRYERLNQYIDHTLLKAEATPEQIENLVKEAQTYKFKSVCDNFHPMCPWLKN